MEAGLQALWSFQTVKTLSHIFGAFRPDVVHAHNTWSLVSPSVYWAAAKAGVPTVNTLHNFRLLCPQATFLRKKTICEDCLGARPLARCSARLLPGVQGAERRVGGHAHAAPNVGHLPQPDHPLIALTEFARRKFIEGGLPAERIVVKPNFVDSQPSSVQARSGFLFVGRLSEEKGVAVLVQAVAAAGVAVRVAGTGPDAALLRGQTTMVALGALSGEAVRAEMERALALVLPSVCYENFPRTLVEAFATGLPVIASNAGPLRELVDDGVTGLLFESGDAADLARKMLWAQANPERMAHLGRQARARYEAEFTADQNYEQLMTIYQGAIDEMAKAPTSAAPRSSDPLPIHDC